MSGKLILVPTPIGHMEDITLRALDVLKKCDAILAEDTRQSSKLLKHYGIEKPLHAYHMHNEHQHAERIVQQLNSGKTLALISDAGTPGISDPGFLLVRECRKHAVQVECLPGATAFVPALVKSGLPAHAFTFIGFLPEKKGRQTVLKKLAESEYTFILYEAPHRILKTLSQLAEYLGADRYASVSRELTKMFEETINGTLAELLAHFTTKPPKGEFVLVVQGKT
ncbi:MAG: 16S rRNA (cytidine(1402)-2'-O)-methyltransferase [Bacteroidota bacterium]|jgi:16S rRNA (cytidine1402-2'-O)-methyltransferase